MNVRVFAAAALVAALAVVAVGATGASGGKAADTLTVWLQVDAQSGWPEVVAAANAQFKAQNPGWDVDVQYQTWGTHLAKFDATLAGNSAPDVIEMGNTEMTKYMAAGAFQDLTSTQFPNKSTWLQGLAASGRFGGKIYGVPYYAGSRRGHVSHGSVQPGRRQDPDEHRRVHRRREEARCAEQGEGVLAGLHRRNGLVHRDELRATTTAARSRSRGRASGSAARQAGRARRPGRVQAILRRRVACVEDDRRGSPSARTTSTRRATLRRSSGPAWFSCCVGDANKARTAQFVMPSRTKGQPMPGFLGGSDLAVPIGANKDKAAAWISAFTDNASMTALRAKGNIPNTTSLLGNSVNERAARKSWFVPTAKNWVNVENGNILRTMLARILTGKSSIKDAASVAERQHHVHPESVGSNSMTVAAETTAHRSRRRPRTHPSRPSRLRSLPADPAGRRGDHGDPRLPALQARHALVPAVRAPGADPAEGRLDRLRQLHVRAAGRDLLADRCSAP